MLGALAHGMSEMAYGLGWDKISIYLILWAGAGGRRCTGYVVGLGAVGGAPLHQARSVRGDEWKCHLRRGPGVLGPCV
jgi:hypothetical protein